MSSAFTATLAIPSEALTLVAAPPIMLTQHNVEAVLGMPASIFLDRVKAPGFPIQVVKMGKLRMVDCAAFVAWVKAFGAVAANEVDECEAERQAALEEIGYERAPRRFQGRK